MALAAKGRRRKDWSRLLKSSQVRRSEQGKGAQEPDLVVEGCPCWIECQDARASEPLEKYAQAVRDIKDTGSALLAAAVCHKTHEKKIGVWMSLADVITLGGGCGLLEPFQRMVQPVRMDLGDWLWLLRCWKERVDG
jgi:hypothetical protein